MVGNARRQLCIIHNDRNIGKRSAADFNQARLYLQHNIEPQRDERLEKSHMQNVLAYPEAKLSPNQQLSFNR